MRARVKIGSRLAEVTVLRQLDGRGRARYECRTADTNKLIRATAARLRPMPPPAVRAMVDRMVEAAARRDDDAIELGGVEAPALAIVPDAVAASAAACGWDASWLREHMEAWLDRAATSPLTRCGLRRAILSALADCPSRPMHAGWPELAEAGERLLDAEARFVPVASGGPGYPGEPPAGVSWESWLAASNVD